MLGALGGTETTNVELELLALENVAVAAAALTGAGGDGGVETTGTELLLDKRVELALLATGVEFPGGLVALLGLVSGGFGSTLTGSTTLGGDGLTVELFVCLTERRSVNLNDASLDQGVGSNKFVVRRIVNDTQHTRLGGNVLRTPCKVAGLETKGTVLEVASTNTNSVDSLGANTGVGSLTTELESSLLAVVRPSGTGGRALVARITSDTHVCVEW